MPRFSTAELCDVGQGVLEAFFGDEDRNFHNVRGQEVNPTNVKVEPSDNNDLPSSLGQIPAHRAKKRARERSDYIGARHESPFPSIKEEASPSVRAIADLGPPAKKRRKSHKPVRACSTCLDELGYGQLMFFNCGCPEVYCRRCLDMWYSTTLCHKTFPTCCGKEVLDDEIFDILSPKTRRRYRDVLEERKEKSAEATPLYCSLCRQFIRASQVKDSFGTCPTCKVKTCVDCKALRRDHKGIYNLCPTFLNEPATSNLGPNYRRCPKCFVMIERSRGCNELRCKCRCVFCFECGAKKCCCSRQPERK